MKKTAALCVVVFFVLTMFLVPAHAAPAYDGEVNANAVMLLDATTGEVLYEKNADERIRPASTTKILTAIVVLENVSSLDEEITVGPEGEWSNTAYSLLKTKNGEKISIKDLLYGMMIVSGDDAASTLAVAVGGSEEHFVEMMNEKAKEIGMTSSHFANPHGTDDDDHYVTARDMAKLALYAMKNETFMDIVGRATYDMPKTNKNPARTVENTNKLLFKDDPEYYPYATGIKTGSTPKAFRCLVSSAKKDDTQLLCLVFGDETESGTERWPLSRKLFDYGFNNYRTMNVQSIIDDTDPISVDVQNAADGDDGVLELNVVNTGDEYKTFEAGLADSIESGGVKSSVELYSGDTLNAPVNKGDAVGIMTYRSAVTGDVVCQGQLIASRGVSAAGGETAAPTDDSSASPSVVTPPKNADNGGGSLVWLYIVGAVVLACVIMALVAVSVIRKRRRLARRRALRRRR